jgi:CarD family transcriptional regulator
MPKIKKTKTKKKPIKKNLLKKSKIKVKVDKKSSGAPLKITNNNTYSPEAKVEIKKIKKQPSEKRLYDIKDYVVYPKHGVGKIIAVEKATIGQIDIHF